ncbi:MAG: outer membrane protein transport protein [Planctomycetota bacterium]|nr:outer membrane protein transport protein [Planctomycetota bacterium]
MRQRWISAICVMALVAGSIWIAPEAEAGGVGLLETGGKRMGSAYAGGAASADDATTIWWNPAGMARLRRHSAAVAAVYIAPTFEYTDQGSLDVASMPIIGVNADGAEDAVVPSAFVAWRLNRKWNVGLSVNVPFGLSTSYPDNFYGRYYATDSELFTLNINPAVAYRINNRLSIGAGFNAMYADATLENQVDFGASAMMPQALDGSAKIEGDGWGFGFNVGLLYEVNCCTRFGIHYRSRVTQEIEGDGSFVVPGPVQPGLPPGLFTNSAAETEIDFPDSLSVSAYHRVNNRWAVMGDVTWTNWETFDELVVDFANPVQPNTVLEFDWKDTFRVGVGVAFTPNSCWEFRAGVLFDEGPASTSNRTPRVPDADRLWVTAGVGYRINNRLRVDLSYAHIFGSEVDVRQTSPTAGTLRGTYEDSDANLFGLQVTVDF